MFDETPLGARTNRRETGDPLREAAPGKHRHAGRLAKRVLAGIVVVTSACGSTADPCAETSVVSCEVDGYEASCGGTGEPTVACSNDRCVRFATACVPDGFRVVECPLSDLCCEEVDGAPWPWDETSTSSPTQIAHDLALIESVHAADLAWPIEVLVDTGLTIERESVACTGSTEAWCTGSAHEWRESTSQVTYRLGRDLGGEGLVIEISGDRARALSVFRFDVSGGGGPASCDVPTVGRYLPATGTFVVSAEPGATRPAGRLTLTFEDGATVISEFPSL